MVTQADKRMATIIQEIRKCFQFLFDRGFHVSKITNLLHDNWEVEISKGYLVIVIYCDQGEIGILFKRADARVKYEVGLGPMIYYLSNEQTIISRNPSSLFHSRKKRLAELAELLKTHLNQITPYFDEDYERYKPEILLAQQKAMNIYFDKHLSK